MLHENLNEETDPKDMENKESSSDKVKDNKKEKEESYDILPSNSAGLEGNDGQQVIGAGENDEESGDEEADS